MWFWFSLLTLICWSGSDLFSKIGCRDANDKYNHLKMLGAVGIVMGIHALIETAFCGVVLDVRTIITYLPVSTLYISSMALGYLGLRYIELSISSPICNSSGAIVAILTLATAASFDDLSIWTIVAVFLVCAGVVGLGVVEANEDDELRKARQDIANQRYSKSWIAIVIPIIYCLLDALGTFADSKVLEVLDEDAANCAYEFTFLVIGLISLFYTCIIKKQPLVLKSEAPKYTGALFETAGQFFYIYALADSAHVAYSAPIISSYCVASVIWSRIFLKEKLSNKHYICVATVILGIIIMGILDI